jgi:hypothetical protein
VFLCSWTVFPGHEDGQYYLLLVSRMSVHVYLSVLLDYAGIPFQARSDCILNGYALICSADCTAVNCCSHSAAMHLRSCSPTASRHSSARHLCSCSPTASRLPPTCNFRASCCRQTQYAGMCQRFVERYCFVFGQCSSKPMHG